MFLRFLVPLLTSLLLFVSCASAASKDSSSLSWKLLKEKTARLDDHGKTEESPKMEELRQYGHGWGWSPSYSTGGYDIYTLIAVSAFAALLGALFFELATGGTFRSLDSSFFTLPFGGLTFNTNQISEVLSKVAEIVSELDWDEIMNKAEQSSAPGVKSRPARDLNDRMGVLQWIKAYKKDPIAYQCIRKVACQTLADSPLVAKSMKSVFGGVILSTVGYFIENGNKLESIVKDTIGKPEKCRDMAPWGFCDDDIEDELNSEEANSLT